MPRRTHNVAKFIIARKKRDTTRITYSNTLMILLSFKSSAARRDRIIVIVKYMPSSFQLPRGLDVEFVNIPKESRPLPPVKLRPIMRIRWNRAIKKKEEKKIVYVLKILSLVLIS